uniref:Uncharacterized protein n=1 Tax=Heliothis virescens TaxID=7102 RepID=A0A2A4JZT9_HELVI
MTVKEGSPVFQSKFPMTKLNPFLGPKYYQYAIPSSSHGHSLVQPWDLMLGVNTLASYIANQKNPPEKKTPVSDLEVD